MESHAYQRNGIIACCIAALLLLLAPGTLLAATFVVNSTADSVDINPGDGLCRDAQGRCTLRAAIMESDALPSWDVIDLSQINDPANPIVLDIPGIDETYTATDADPPWVVTGTPDPSRGDLDITDSLTIQGAGPDKTIVEWPAAAKTAPATADRVFHIQKTDHDISVRISGLTVRNGVTTTPQSLSVTADGLVWMFKRKGGGIAIGPGAYMELVDPNKQHGLCGTEGGHGSAGHGGGEDEDCGGETGLQVTLDDVYLLDNQSGSDGGGLYNTAPLTLANSVISGNSAKSKGGGLYNGAELTMYNTLIGAFPPQFPDSNSAKNGGGMFDGAFHESHIRDSAFIGNQGGNGGGIAGRRRVLMYLTNSTISNNIAGEAGGGISTNGQIILLNDTLADNLVITPEGGNTGAGINVFAMGSYSYINTLFSHNTLQDANGPISSCGTSGEALSSSSILVSGGHNLADDATCHLDAGKGDLADTPVSLAPLAYNDGPTPTRALLSGSPAVDAGDTGQCPNNDQRGSLRPAGGVPNGDPICDIGAYELFVHTADLHIEDVTAPDQVAVGDEFAVAIHVHNDAGATSTASGVTLVSDPLPDELQISQISIQPENAASSCNRNNSILVCSLGEIGIGQIVKVTLTGTSNVPGNYTLGTHLSSAAPVDPAPLNNDDHLHIQILGQSRLLVSFGPSQILSYVGTDTGIPITVHNDGPDPASHVRLLLTFSSGVIYRDSSFGDACSYSADDGSLLCLLGDLDSGKNISGTVTVSATTAGVTSLASSLDADQVTPGTTDSPGATASIVYVDTKMSTDNRSSGGGCVMNQNGEFDPVLPAILILGLIMVLGRLSSKFR